MNKVEKRWKDFVVEAIKKRWNDVLFDGCCVYSDGAMALCFCVTIESGKNVFISDVLEIGESGTDIIDRLNNRIAWTFASEHLRNVQ